MNNNRRKITILLFMILATIAFADQNNNKSPLPTLTPAPAMSVGVDRNVVSLDGQWIFNQAQSKKLLDDKWENIIVPGQWLQQGFKVNSENFGYYRKVFSVPKSWGNMTIKLHCDGIYSQSKIWINDTLAGEHIGGFTAFELDVTDFVKPGEKNRIDIEVKTESLANELATGTKYAAHDLGGITRKIYLFAAPKVHVSSVQLQTSFDAEYKNAKLKMIFEVTNNSPKTVEELHIRFKIKDTFNNIIKATPSVIKLKSIPSGSTISQTEEIEVTSPKKWDCENPNLYDLFYTVYADAQKLEIGKETFGFRDIEIRGKKLFINGKAVKLRGICRHEAHPLLGRSLTAPLWEQDALLLKEANINFVRTSHYPPAEEFIQACDKYGIFVEEEAPFCWVGEEWGNSYWTDKKVDDPNVRELIVKETLEMVQRDKNHPSIIMWSLANESIWSEIFENSGNALKALDPSRPRKFTNPPDSDFCEIEVWHYPGPQGPAKTEDANRPVIFSEYCHLNTYNRREIYTDPGLLDYWGNGFYSMWNNMYKAENCLGGSIWAGISDTFYVTGEQGEIEIIGYGDWGPIDGWRREKPEYWHIKKTYSPIKIPVKKIVLPDNSYQVRIAIINQYDFSNLNELNIEVKTAEKTAVLKANIPAGGQGYLEIPLKMFANSDTVQLNFMHKKGYLVDSFILPVTKNSKKEIAKKQPTVSERPAPKIIRDENGITITGDNFQWCFNSQTGLLEKAVIDSNTIKIAGPLLTVNALVAEKGQRSVQKIEVLNGEMTNFEASKIDTIETKTEAIIQIIGKYGEDADGFYTMAFDANGVGKFGYRFAYKKVIDPRETGVTFTLARQYDLLSWNRNAQWTVYPQDHIGRPEGSAKALPDPNQLNLPVNHQPDWPWYLDATAAGTNDFRSSKYNINYASLTDVNGVGIKVISDGKQTSRSYIEGDSIKLLVADYANGGYDPFFKSHLKHEYRPLEIGDVIKGTVTIQLVGQKKL
ncbi:MAG TPA: glycoside hydrolase family 2 TIM barrel-domain containing protein [Sedimentisphaerales bacterium]|nr:glycoside hydrolase family 2 TIM barrel-domain containing protein [Sedimentisphaerales bacterium]